MKTGIVNIKFVTYFVIASVIVSFFAGIIGGVPFFTLIIRMFLGAVIFAGLGAGVAFVLEKFMPDVMNTVNNDENKANENAEDEVDELNEEGITDSGINIVMDEENPHNLKNETEYEVTENEENLEDESVRYNENTDAEEEEEFIEDALDVEAEESAEEEINEPSEKEFNDESEKENVYSSNNEQQTEQSEDSEEVLSINDTLGLDDLPNINNIDESFSQTDTYTETSDLSSSKNYDMLGENNDPETAAKAIKTWLNKDKKG